MVAPMYGSPGGRLARALTRALALALVLALLVGLFLSGLTGAIPISGRQWGPNGPVPPESRSRSVLLDAETGQLRLVDGRHPDAVAWANLTNAIRETGWAFLELQTNGRYNDSLQAYAAGVAEAAVSEELIYMHWMNTVVNYCGPFEYEVGYCEKLKSFLETNLEWMQEEMELNKGSAYWHQVRLTLLQLKGLEDSYEGSMTFPTGRFTIKPLGFLLLQLAGDLGDLEPALNKTKTKHVMGSGSCSALIKLLPGQTDLLIAHNTWSAYQNMLRVIKKYWFQFREDPQENSPLAPGNKLVFSSYPGALFSCDDFYIIGSGLVTLETTIGNRNPALWKYVQPKDCVLEWLRNVVANRLALDGDAWADTFKRFNSGTGMVVVADKTSELYQKTYWASYNIPYFESVFNASGLQALVAQYGDWFSYDGSPRAQIFRRNQSLVHDLDSMLRLMRYNDFLHDPLSLCKACNPQANAENAISARSDLNPANGSYPFQALHQRSHGGIDVKVTSMALARAFHIIAVSGPTWDQLPPFQWSSSPFSGLLHMGQPDLWKFSPIEVWWD
ncbi:putative phospholipase B-like 2 isoform X2 [Neomonachus schauinslandi]|uniref:Phospholipase B-like n=1 Tax=Neomonachus schauinslandi TaxID=29088 RepID=A0A8M1MYT4_NEOSC|nr:putative phospholipase B-like 2 isoform X2 [Neomonachus schauinslandi]